MNDDAVAGLMLVHLSQWIHGSDSAGADSDADADADVNTGAGSGADSEADGDGGGDLVGSLDDMPTGSLRQVRREKLANGYINTFNVSRYCLTLKSLLFNSSSSFFFLYIF